MPKLRGSPLVLKNGVWWIDTTLDGRRWRESTGRTSKAEAKVLYEQKRRGFLLPPDPTAGYQVRDALEHYVERQERRYKEGFLSRARWEIARDKSRNLVQELPKGLLANELRPRHTEAYAITRTGQQASPETIRMELQTLISALRYARRMERCNPNLDLMPEDYRQRAGKTVYRARERHLTVKEFEKLLAHVQPARRGMIAAYVYTGASRGELLACRVRDVNLKQGALHLPGRKAFNRDRWLPIHPELRPILEEAVKGKSPDDPLFPPWGKRGDGMNSELRRACIKAGIPHTSPNDLRRTFNSWLRHKGEDEGKVAGMMGHHNVQMGRKIYTQWDHESFEKAIRKLPKARVPNVPKNDSEKVD